MADRTVTLADRLALRPKEAAETLGVGERTVRKWMRDDALSCQRLDNVILISRHALEQWRESPRSVLSAEDVAHLENKSEQAIRGALKVIRAFPGARIIH